MKNKIPVVVIMVSAFAFISMQDKLVGHWMTKGQNNSKVFLDFSEDHSFKVTVDGHIENEGKYELKEDVFTMYDKGCGMNVPGKYKLTFYTSDSVSFSVLQDSCKDRVGEVNGGIITRVKN
jgi:hypothetical protein